MVKYFLENVYLLWGWIALLMVLSKIARVKAYKATQRQSLDNKIAYFALSPSQQEELPKHMFNIYDILLLLIVFAGTFFLYRQDVEYTLYARSIILGFMTTAMVTPLIGNIHLWQLVKYNIKTAGKEIDLSTKEFTPMGFYNVSSLQANKYIWLILIICVLTPSAFLMGVLLGTLDNKRNIVRIKKKYLKLKPEKKE